VTVQFQNVAGVDEPSFKWLSVDLNAMDLSHNNDLGDSSDPQNLADMDHYKASHSCISLDTSSGTDNDRGLGNLFQVLNDLTDIHQHQNVMIEEDPNNYQQMLEDSER